MESSQRKDVRAACATFNSSDAGCSWTRAVPCRQGRRHSVGLVHRLISGSQPGGPMAILPIFCVARSSRTDLSMLVARALKIGQIADGGMPPTYETIH